MTRKLVPLLSYIPLLALSAIFLAPFIFMLSTSLQTTAQTASATVQWIPHPIRWQNYPDALANFPFWQDLRNTLFICVTCIIGTLFSSALPAYGFARMQWKGRELLFIAMIATIMLPGQVTQMPVFLMFRSLHWTGTFLPLIVPSFFGNAFSIFMLRQFFLGIPQELSDAARIDGCSEFGIFWRIMLPLAKPPLAAISLFTFMGCWTDFQNPLIYLQNEKYFTLAIGLSSFLGRHTGEWNLLMAASAVVTVPVVVLFFLTQKTFVKGVASTGIK